MITGDSLFTDFIDLIVKAGACSSESPFSGIPFLEELSKICGEKATCNDVMILHEANDKVNDEWVSWVITNIGKEMEPSLRSRYMRKITNFKICMTLRMLDFLTEEEKLFLDSILKNEQQVQKVIDSISEPMEAARMLIDFPHLTNTQEMILKDKFEGRLPNVEKEITTGVILTAKSQVVK